MQIKRYRETKALSQSSLKLLDSDIKAFYRNEQRWLTGEIPSKPEYRVSEAMKLGEVVDALVTSPTSFNDNYSVCPQAPKGQMLSFIDEYIRLEKIATDDYANEISKDSVQQLAQQAYEYAGFKKDSLPKVLERFKTEGLNYYNAHKQAGERVIVTHDMMSHAQSLVSSLMSDAFVSQALKPDDPDIELHYQMELYHDMRVEEEETVACKGLIDIVAVNHREKVITLVDLKTTSDDYFPNAVVKYRYDLQGSFYSYMFTRSDFLRQSKEREAYIVNPFLFIVINTINHKPSMWRLSDKDSNVGANGGVRRDGICVKGWQQLIQDYKWHCDNDIWDHSRELVRNHGVKSTNCY